MWVIEARDVSKAFQIPTVRRDTMREHLLGFFQRRRFETLQVLESVNLQVERGETLGIMGRNGSGKSTLLKILSGVYTPDRGRVTVTASLTPILELGIGWNPELDAIDNIMLLGTVMGLTLWETRHAIDGILDFADLTRFANLELKHYSTGMASRVGADAFHRGSGLPSDAARARRADPGARSARRALRQAGVLPRRDAEA